MPKGRRDTVICKSEVKRKHQMVQGSGNCRGFRGGLGARGHDQALGKVKVIDNEPKNGFL